MIKSLTAGLCILAFSSGLALAQSSQGQAGADTGPTNPTSQMTRPNAMNSRAQMGSSDMMRHKHMRKHHMMRHHSMKSGMSNDGMSGGMKKDGMMNNGMAK
jgi:pentapeptide MXKDX repeat protein